MNIEEKAFAVFSNIMDVPLEEVKIESSPTTIETWDSITHMNLIFALENEFEVHFTEGQILELFSVKVIIETLNNILGNE